MPIYVFRCGKCGETTERLLTKRFRKSTWMCSNGACGGEAVRSYELEGCTFVPDIEPYYDLSLGEHIKSRQDKRDALKFLNAYDPTMERGGTPTGGLKREEQAELVSKEKTKFGAMNPGLNLGKKIDTEIVVEGETDRSDAIKVIKDRHKQELIAKGRPDLIAQMP